VASLRAVTARRPVRAFVSLAFGLSWAAWIRLLILRVLLRAEVARPTEDPFPAA
jgi:hypothetical protein